MKSISRKLWVGIGTVVIASAAPLVASAQHAKHGADAKSKAAEAGAPAMGTPQSGEAYLTDGGPKDTRVRIYRDIALMRGHLLVGGELVELGRWDDALPHFLHPTEELYGAMERYIKLHKVTPFDRQLKQLAQAVKARNKAAYVHALKVADERISNALTSFRRFMQGPPFTSFTMQTAVEVLKIAAAEYEASIEDGKFTKPVEYQDSRGFVLYVEMLMGEQRASLEKVDKHAFEGLLRLVAEMKRAWPSPLPPGQPVVAPKDIAAQIDDFARRAERFF